MNKHCTVFIDLILYDMSIVRGSGLNENVHNSRDAER